MSVRCTCFLWLPRKLNQNKRRNAQLIGQRTRGKEIKTPKVCDIFPIEYLFLLVVCSLAQLLACFYNKHKHESSFGEKIKTGTNKTKLFDFCFAFVHSSTVDVCPSNNDMGPLFLIRLRLVMMLQWWLTLISSIGPIAFRLRFLTKLNGLEILHLKWFRLSAGSYTDASGWK